MKRPRQACFVRQQGIALLTAILILAVASIAATAMTVRGQVDTRRAANVFDGDQAESYLSAGEVWAAQILKRDLSDNSIDTLGDQWAVQLPPLPVDGGQVSGRIEDLQGRFNLNSLVAEGRPQTLQLERFRRLLAVLEIPPSLANAVLDWIDADEEVQFDGGAEDSAYQRRERGAYRAANRPMVSVSELRLVRGFSEEYYRRLQPYVYAVDASTAINVNTAPAPVIACLVDGVSLAAAEDLVQRRGKAGYASVKAFLQDDIFTGTGIKSNGLTVRSNYFLLTGEAWIDRVRRLRVSIIHRAGVGGPRVVMRSRGWY